MTGALRDRSWIAAVVLGLAGIVIALRTVNECAAATAATLALLETPDRRPLSIAEARGARAREARVQTEQPTPADPNRGRIGDRRFRPLTDHWHPPDRLGPTEVADRREAN